MAERQELIFELSARTGQFTKEFQAARRRLQSFGSDLQGAVGGLAFSAPVVALGGAATLAAANLDALKRGLAAASAEAGNLGGQLADLREIAKLPGLGFEEAVRGSINLQSVGFSVQRTNKILREFGNALAVSGRGKADLDEVIRQLGQLASRGKVTADNLKPIIERIPQASSVLRNALGTIDTEQLQKAGVTAEQVIQVLITEFAKLPRVTGGLKNDLENLQDSINQTLEELGNGVQSPVSKTVGVLDVLLTKVREAAVAFRELGPGAQGLALTITGVAVAIPPAIAGLGFMVTQYTALTTAIKAAGGAAGVLTTALRFAGYAAIAGEVLYLAQAFLRMNEAFSQKDAAQELGVGALLKLEERARAAGIKVDELRKKFNVSITKSRQLENPLSGEFGPEITQATGQVKEYTQALLQQAAAASPIAPATDRMRSAFRKLAEEFAASGNKDPREFARRFEALKKQLGAGVVAQVQTADVGKQIEELNARVLEGKLSFEAYGRALSEALTPQAAKGNGDAIKDAFSDIGVKDAIKELADFRKAFALLTSQGRLGPGQLQEAFKRLTELQEAARKATEGVAGEFGSAANRAALLKDALAGIDPATTFERAAERLALVGIQVDTSTAAIARARAEFAALVPLGQQRFFDGLLSGLKQGALSADSMARRMAFLRGELAALLAIGKTQLAFDTLNIIPQAKLEEQAKAARDAYDRIGKDSQSTAFDIRRAWIAMIDAQIAAGQVLDRKTLESYRRIREGIERQLNPARQAVNAFRQQVSTILTGLSRDIANAILDTNKKQQAQPLVAGVPDGVVESFRRAYAELSGKGFADATVPLRQIIDRITQAGTAAEAAAVAARHFGETGPAIANLLRSGAISADQLNQILGRSADVFGETAKTAEEELGRVSKVIQSLERALIRAFVETGIDAVGKFVKAGLGSLLSELGKTEGAIGRISRALAGLLGRGGASAAGQAASSVPGALPGVIAAGSPAAATGIIGGVGGAPAKAAGSAASSLTGIVGAVGSVVSAISGVIGNFQMAGMNKTLDLIEKETRYSQIHLLHLLEKANEYWPWAKENTMATHLVRAALFDPVNSTLEKILGASAAATGGQSRAPRVGLAQVPATAAPNVGRLSAALSGIDLSGISKVLDPLSVNLAPKLALAGGGTAPVVNGGIHLHGVQDVDGLLEAMTRKLKLRGTQVRS